MVHRVEKLYRQSLRRAHTLAEQMKQIEKLLGSKVEEAHVVACAKSTPY
jgi:heme oxygenase